MPFEQEPDEAEETTRQTRLHSFGSTATEFADIPFNERHLPVKREDELDTESTRRSVELEERMRLGQYATNHESDGRAVVRGDS